MDPIKTSDQRKKTKTLSVIFVLHRGAAQKVSLEGAETLQGAVTGDRPEKRIVAAQKRGGGASRVEVAPLLDGFFMFASAPEEAACSKELHAVTIRRKT
ncbi:hypothetical protein PAMP_004675 [Pampus punctatissimus]